MYQGRVPGNITGAGPAPRLTPQPACSGPVPRAHRQHPGCSPQQRPEGLAAVARPAQAREPLGACPGTQRDGVKGRAPVLSLGFSFLSLAKAGNGTREEDSA